MDVDVIVVSVIIPTYNRADYIGATVESVLQQTYTNFEIIIIDDGSVDNTKEVIKGFNDCRIRYYFQSNSGLPACARNRGIELSRGEYIAFLDSDDIWMPGKLDKQLAFFKKYPDLTLIATNYFVNNRKAKEIHFLGNKRISFRELLKKNIISNSSVLIRMDIVEEVGFLDENPKIKATEDYDYWLRILKLKDNSAFFLNLPLITYRFHSQGISRGEDFQDPNVRYQKVKIIFEKHKDIGLKKIKRALDRVNRDWGNVVLKLKYSDGKKRIRDIICSEELSFFIKCELLLKNILFKILRE